MWTSYLLLRPCIKKLGTRLSDSRVIWSARHVEDDARFQVRWKHSGDSEWLKNAKFSRFQHTVVLIRRRTMPVWCLAVARIKWSWARRETVIAQSAALFLHTLSFSQQTQSLWNLPGPWADCLGNVNSHGGILKHANLQKLLNILLVGHLNQPQWERKTGRGRQRENLDFNPALQ